RREFLGGVDRTVLEKRGREAVHRARVQRVPVRGGVLHRHGGDLAAGPGPVFHHYGLAQLWADLGRDHSRQHVGSAARAIADDDVYGLVRVRLRRGRLRETTYARDNYKESQRTFHLSSLLFRKLQLTAHKQRVVL